MSDESFDEAVAGLTIIQTTTLLRKMDELAPHAHWHRNDCGCCISVHGRDCAYIINSEGEEFFFADRGCACPLEE